MKLLLDTHIWIWSVGDPQRLSRRVAKALEDVHSARLTRDIEPFEIWIEREYIWIFPDLVG